MFWLPLSLIFLLLYALLLFFYWQKWAKLSDFNVSGSNGRRFISVIVPARNEEKNIAPLLKALSEQSYSKDFFEIIIVDDFSTDATAQIVRFFSLANLLFIQPNTASELSSKKRAIEAGIQKAKGELIVTTDADCIPPEHWLATINDFYATKNAAFMAAPVKFSHNNSLLQLFQALDFFDPAGNYSGQRVCKFPYHVQWRQPCL